MGFFPKKLCIFPQEVSFGSVKIRKSMEKFNFDFFFCQGNSSFVLNVMIYFVYVLSFIIYMLLSHIEMVMLFSNKPDWQNKPDSVKKHLEFVLRFCNSN